METDLDWYVADGLGSNNSGTIGAWALKSARLLSELYRVPIAVLNGAVGGTAISYHLRDDVRWSDGEPFSSRDVIATYGLFVNDEVRTPWRA